MPRLFTDNKLQEMKSNYSNDFPSRDLRACSIESRSFARSGFSSAQKPLPAGYPLGEIPLFCRSDNRFYRMRTAFTRILLEKVTFFLFIRKIGRFKYKSGDLPRNREPPDQIGRVGTFGVLLPYC
jgi:hypothetical protein